MSFLRKKKLYITLKHSYSRWGLHSLPNEVYVLATTFYCTLIKCVGFFFVVLFVFSFGFHQTIHFCSVNHTSFLFCIIAMPLQIIFWKINYVSISGEIKKKITEYNWCQKYLDNILGIWSRLEIILRHVIFKLRDSANTRIWVMSLSDWLRHLAYVTLSVTG